MCIERTASSSLPMRESMEPTAPSRYVRIEANSDDDMLAEVPPLPPLPSPPPPLPPLPPLLPLPPPLLPLPPHPPRSTLIV